MAGLPESQDDLTRQGAEDGRAVDKGIDLEAGEEG